MMKLDLHLIFSRIKMNSTVVVASLVEVNQLFEESRDSINSCW